MSFYVFLAAPDKYLFRRSSDMSRNWISGMSEGYVPWLAWDESESFAYPVCSRLPGVQSLDGLRRQAVCKKIIRLKTLLFKVFKTTLFLVYNVSL